MAVRRTYSGRIPLDVTPVKSTIPITSNFPGRIPIGGGGGGRVAVQNLPTGQSIATPTLQNTATGGVFGGINGGAGTAATPHVAAPLSIGGISSSISSVGGGIMNTVGTIIPLAIKIIVAVIVIKIIWWLIKGRRR